MKVKLEKGYPAEEIINKAKQIQVDLIVIGSRGLMGMKSFF